MRNDDRPRNYRQDTLLTHLGRNPEAQHGAINPPVYHASTILSKNIAEWESRPRPESAVRRRALRPVGHADDLCARGTAGEDRGRLPRRDRLVGAGRGHRAVAGLRQRRRPRADGRFGATARRAISANRVLTRCGVETTYYDPLIGDGHRAADAAQYQGRLCRIARLADLRGAGHPGDRRGRAPLRRQGADGQYLGDALSVPLVRARRRCLDPRRDQIYRRPFRHHARRGRDQRGKLAAGALDDRRSRPLRRARTTSFSPCAACAP